MKERQVQQVMQAIIVTGGKQYNVSEGDTLFIEKLDVNAGDSVVFDQVLAIVDGENTKFGTPVVEGAKVDATVVKNGKGKKIRIFKYTPKKGYRKRQGHRQPYTKVEIGKISLSGMTTGAFLTEDARIIEIDVQGHSGWGESGEDIVCAAITSAVRLVEATVNDVMGLCAAVKVREADASISLRLPGGLANTAESTCQNLLTGLMVYLAQLHDEYPDNIEVMEG